MPVRSILWRVVLCIGLILNGSAFASMSMVDSQSSHAVEHMAADATVPSLHAACHDHVGGMALLAAHQHTPASPVPGRNKPATPDCCSAGTCACVCLQSQAGVAIVAFDHLAMQAVATGQARVRHDEPVLPHLIRPPIG